MLTLNEIFEKYGDTAVYFSNYYKYVFTFTSNNVDGDKITVECGGNPDEIYRASFSDWETVAGLDNETEILSIRVNGKEIYNSF